LIILYKQTQQWLPKRLERDLTKRSRSLKRKKIGYSLLKSKTKKKKKKKKKITKLFRTLMDLNQMIQMMKRYTQIEIFS